MAVVFNTSVSSGDAFCRISHSLFTGNLPSSNNLRMVFWAVIDSKPDKLGCVLRVSKIPFTKWYVKKYLIKYELGKIMAAIEKNEVDNLNKNLKTKANKLIRLSKMYDIDLFT